MIFQYKVGWVLNPFFLKKVMWNRWTYWFCEQLLIKKKAVIYPNIHFPYIPPQYIFEILKICTDIQLSNSWVSSSIFSLFGTLKKLSISHDPLHTSILVFRSQETPIDGQPPALPPKQFKKNSWNQIHHSHSQQELDNHINETFDVPASPEKSTVSFWIQFDHWAFYRNDSPTFIEVIVYYVRTNLVNLVLMHFQELLRLCITL